MGYARVVSGGTDGRYTVEIDTGEAFRVAILNALLLKYVDVSAKVIQQEAAVAAADAAEADMRVSITAFANSIAAFQLSAGTDLGSLTGLTKIYSDFLMVFRKAQAKNAPLRTTLETLKRIKVETARKRTSIENVLALRTRQAWCCDLTENRGAGSFVATVDIPGESNLILIAPGARTPLSGDGKIPQARKDANLTPLLAQLDKLTAEKANIDDKITIAKSEETVLKAAQAFAQLVYKANPSEETAKALIAATEKLNKKKSDIIDLQMSLHVVNLRIYGVKEKITYWSNRPAAEKPIYGDGHLYERALMSPEQVYVNTAILPGWQKYKPTYRWGTCTNLDREANTMTVTLAAATSSAQNLDVNQTPQLTGIPVKYMTCDCAAFEDGDSVIVEFKYLDWGQPTVIGFLENPKPCTPRNIYVLGDGGPQNIYNEWVGFEVPEQYAAANDELTEDSYYSKFGHFLGWFKNGVFLHKDHVLQRFKVTKDDPETIEIARQYYRFPKNLYAKYSAENFIVQHDNSTSWELVLGETQYEGTVTGTTTWRKTVGVNYSDFDTGDIILDDVTTGISTHDVIWTGPYGVIYTTGPYFSPPNPLEQLHPEDFPPPFDLYGSSAGMPPLNEMFPVISITTIYGTAVYYVSSVLNASTCIYLIVNVE